eukprot:scpid110249/ scgid13912/ 
MHCNIGRILATASLSKDSISFKLETIRKNNKSKNIPNRVCRCIQVSAGRDEFILYQNCDAKSIYCGYSKVTVTRMTTAIHTDYPALSSSMHTVQCTWCRHSQSACTCMLQSFFLQTGFQA